MHVPQQTIEGVRQVAVQRETMHSRVLGDRLEPRMLRQREASPTHLGRQAVGGQWQQLVTLGQVAHQSRRLAGQLLHDRSQQTRPWQRAPLAALLAGQPGGEPGIHGRDRRIVQGQAGIGHAVILAGVRREG